MAKRARRMNKRKEIMTKYEIEDFQVGDVITTEDSVMSMSEFWVVKDVLVDKGPGNRDMSRLDCGNGMVWPEEVKHLYRELKKGEQNGTN